MKLVVSAGESIRSWVVGYESGEVAAVVVAAGLRCCVVACSLRDATLLAKAILGAARGMEILDAAVAAGIALARALLAAAIVTKVSQRIAMRQQRASTSIGDDEKCQWIDTHWRLQFLPMMEPTTSMRGVSRADSCRHPRSKLQT